MRRKEPLVSVLLTVYNAAPFLRLALQSLVNQTYRHLEILVIDDGSTDMSPEIIKNFEKNDCRIKSFRFSRNVGPSLASNFGLRKAKGDFIARMDADDIAFSDRLQKQVNFLMSHPEVVVVGGQCFLINEDNEVIGEKHFPLNHKEAYRSLFILNPIQHPSCLINRRLLPEGDLVYSEGSVLAHDLELVFRLSQYGELANLPETVLYYRKRAESLSLKDPKKTFADTLAVRKKALLKYHYRPTLKGWLIHLSQVFLLSLLPTCLIYPLFCRWRVQQVKSGNQPGLLSGWQNIFTGAFLMEEKYVSEEN